MNEGARLRRRSEILPNVAGVLQLEHSALVRVQEIVAHGNTVSA
jgi:hypothetical protein